MSDVAFTTSVKSTESRGLSPTVKVVVVLGVLALALALLIFGSQASDAFVYSKLVHEVLDNPASFHGRELRVEGDLRQGTIEFREQPCEYRFVLVKHGKQLPVRFPRCIVPDTFRDGMPLVVTVQGQLQQDNSFLANQIIPRCPSKYEMQKQAASGAERPHYEIPE